MLKLPFLTTGKGFFHVNHRVNHAIRFNNFFHTFSQKSGVRREYGFFTKKYPKTTIFSDFGVLGAEGGI